MPRVNDRSGIDPESRIKLLEADADHFELVIDKIQRSMDEGFASVAVQQANGNRLLLSLLVAVVTGLITVIATGLIG